MLGALAWVGKAIGAPPTPRSALLLAPQDELSHINARLNMGILGCECGPPGWGCNPGSLVHHSRQITEPSYTLVPLSVKQDEGLL